jgi:hypothetical protein
LTYRPVGRFSGDDSFTFQANDGSADSNAATVALSVLPPFLTLGQTAVVPGDTAVLPIIATDAVTNIAGLDLSLRLVSSDGAPILQPTFTLGQQTQGWESVTDSGNPWHFSIINVNGISGPAEMMKLLLPTDLSTPLGTTYRIEAVTATMTDQGGHDTDALSRTTIGELTVGCKDSVIGDVNQDGEVSLGDVILTLRIAVHLVTPSACVLNVGDVNCNGAITLGDAVLVLRNYVLGEPFACSEP